MRVEVYLKKTILDGLTLAILLMALLGAAVNPTTEQLLDLNYIVLIFITSFLSGAFLSYLLNGNGTKTLGQHMFGLPPSTNEVAKPWFRTFWGGQLFITLVVLVTIGLVKSQFSFYELFDADGFAGAKRLFAGIFSPNWDVLPAAVANVIETIFMAFLATIFAVPFAFVFSFAAAKNIMKGPLAFSIYLALRTVLNFARSIEALVWAIIFSVWVGIGPFAGMLALMIHSIASLTKQYSEIVETVNQGPIDGVLATGASELQIIRYAILPQVILPYISFTVYRWDINVRMATVIGLVGGGGIGTMLIKYQGQAKWSEVGTIIIVIAVVVWLMDQASAYIREALK